MSQTVEIGYALPDSTIGSYVFVTASGSSGHESAPSNLVFISPTAFWPTQYALDQNAPNSIKPTTTIDFALPEQAQVHLTI